MAEWHSLIADSLIGEVDESLPTIDVHMFKVQFKPDADKERFTATLRGAMDEGGVFTPMTPERLKEGPSYIELGGFVGDQRDALLVMALGEHHGFWKVMTPASLGIEGDAANAMAGQGFVMIAGFDPTTLTGK